MSLLVAFGLLGTLSYTANANAQQRNQLRQRVLDLEDRVSVLERLVRRGDRGRQRNAQFECAFHTASGDFLGIGRSEAHAIQSAKDECIDLLGNPAWCKANQSNTTCSRLN